MRSREASGHFGLVGIREGVFAELSGGGLLKIESDQGKGTAVVYDHNMILDDGRSIMKILLCDDQAVIRDGLEMLLTLEKDFRSWSVLHRMVLRRLNSSQKTTRPGVNGLKYRDERHRSHSRDPQEISDHKEYPYSQRMTMMNGSLMPSVRGHRLFAQRYIAPKIIEAIRGTVDGKSFVDPAVAGKLLNQVSNNQTQPALILTDKLTDRELDVLRLLAKGLTNADMATQLHLSEGTVRNHVSAILEKLGVSDRTQAAVIAIQHGL